MGSLMLLGSFPFVFQICLNHPHSGELVFMILNRKFVADIYELGVI